MHWIFILQKIRQMKAFQWYMITNRLQVWLLIPLLRLSCLSSLICKYYAQISTVFVSYFPNVFFPASQKISVLETVWRRNFYGIRKKADELNCHRFKIENVIFKYLQIALIWFELLANFAYLQILPSFKFKLNLIEKSLETKQL